MSKPVKKQFSEVLKKLEKQDKEGISKEELKEGAYTGLSFAPVTGEAIAIKELSDDLKQIKDLFEQGYTEKDFKKLGLGTLYTTAVTAGLLPVLGPLGRAGKITKPVKAMDEAKALTNPMIIGSKSPEGQDAIKSYENLRKSNPNLSQDDVYLETGVYLGPDGKYRYNLDNRTAKINDNFKKNEDIINVDNFKKGDTKTFLLKDVMDFKNLYPQYNKPFYNVDNKLVSTKLEDVKVRFVKEEKLGLGSYNFSDDTITINLGSNFITNSDHWFSTLLHETQHAIQHREGFITGANVESVLKKSMEK